MSERPTPGATSSIEDQIRLREEEARGSRLLPQALGPLPEKWHGLHDVETRYRQRYVDLTANPEVRETFLRRAKLITGLRRFLDERDFVEVETPVLHTPEQAGG